MRIPATASNPALPLAAAALLLAPLGVLAPLGIAPLAAAAAVLLLFQDILARRWPAVDRTALILAVLFIGWALVTAPWSLLPERSILGALRVGVILLGGLVLIGATRDLDAAQRRTIGSALILGTVIGAALATAVLLGNFAIHRLLDVTMPPMPISVLNRSAAVAAILCWPAALVALHRWRANGWLVIVVATAVMLLLAEPIVPMIALAVALVAFLLALPAARITATLLIAGLVTVTLLVPVLPDLAPRLDTMLTERDLNENSVSHRLGIWSFGAGRILERPVLGWGFDTARAVPGGDHNVRVRGLEYDDAPSMPLHPHNAVVQIWLEAGLPAILLALGLVVRALVAVPGLGAGRAGTATVLAAAAGCATIASLSYGVWQGWWLCFIWLAMALTLAVTSGARDR